MSIGSNLKHKQRRLSRRRFLQSALPGLGAIIAWEATKGIDAGQGDSHGIREQPKTSGYQETEHIRRYYETARF